MSYLTYTWWVKTRRFNCEVSIESLIHDKHQLIHVELSKVVFAFSHSFCLLLFVFWCLVFRCVLLRCSSLYIQNKKGWLCSCRSVLFVIACDQLLLYGSYPRFRRFDRLFYDLPLREVRKREISSVGRWMRACRKDLDFSAYWKLRVLQSSTFLDYTVMRRGKWLISIAVQLKIYPSAFFSKHW